MSTYIETGNTVRVFDSAVHTHAQMPLGTYKVQFNPFSGYSLQRQEDLRVGEGKVYGGREHKVDKIFRYFTSEDRSLGVMLSGDKGQGKSLFLRMVAERAADEKLPVVIVAEAFPGIADFLDTLGTCVIIFDEFEKVFSDRGEEGANPQHQFLSLFDGTSSMKRLYCVTVNELRHVSSYFVNRPGRFHYHLRFNYPEPDEVREYLADQAPQATAEQVEAAVRFSQKVALNYDHLRAVAYELNDAGSVFSEIIGDLNIKNVDPTECRVHVAFRDGEIATGRASLDLFGDSGAQSMVHVAGTSRSEYITFKVEDLAYAEDGSMEYRPLYPEGRKKKDEDVIHIRVVPTRASSFSYDRLL